MNAEEIVNKEFPVVMRGYVREEVQAFLASVAAQLAERDSRLLAMEEELIEARRRKVAEPALPVAPAPAPAPAVVDRPTLLRALGEEAASILACADASAERMTAQARIDAARVNSDLRGVGTTLVEVHSLLGDLVSLVQGLTNGADLEAVPTPPVYEVQIPEAAPVAPVNVAPVEVSLETDEFRTVVGEVLGLDGSETTEIQLPSESEVSKDS